MPVFPKPPHNEHGHVLSSGHACLIFLGLDMLVCRSLSLHSFQFPLNTFTSKPKGILVATL